MSDDVKISFGDDPRKTAVDLIAAARALDLPDEVVRTTAGAFLVSEEVAEKAGFGENKDGGDRPAKKTAKKTAKKAAAKKSAKGTQE